MIVDFEVQFVILEWAESELIKYGFPFGVVYQATDSSSHSILSCAFLADFVSEDAQYLESLRTDLMEANSAPASVQAGLFIHICNLSMGPVRAGLRSQCSSTIFSLRMKEYFSKRGDWPQQFIDAHGAPLSSNSIFKMYFRLTKGSVLPSRRLS